MRIKAGAKATVRCRWWTFLLVVAITALGVLNPSNSKAQSSMTPAMEWIVRYNAPIIMQETTTDGSQVHRLINHLVPVDFDNDLVGSNNAANLNAGNIIDARPTVYYSIVETGDSPDQGFYFIGYYFYHARDGGFYINFAARDSGHDHDLEGVYLIVQKSAFNPYGTLVLAWSQAHGAMIPYADSTYVNMGATLTNAGAGYWGGKIHTYYDSYFNVNRPVVAVSLDTHGTYFAQTCSAQDAHLGPYTYYEPGGYDWAASTSGSFVGCIRDFAGSAILYRPTPYMDGSAAAMSNMVNAGWWDYRLVNLATTMWPVRMVQGQLFGGSNILSLGDGVQAQDIFQPGDYTNCCANPPWQWQGGYGADRQGIPGNNGFWYRFSDDGTTNLTNWQGPWAPWASGALLMNPQQAAYADFTRYADWRGNATANFITPSVVFNEYRSIIPAQGCGQLLVSIAGPDVLNTGSTGTWTANVGCGIAPFTYQWTGAVSGSGQSVTATMYGDSDIYLDVWDAVGAHVAVSKHVAGTGCSGADLC